MDINVVKDMGLLAKEAYNDYSQGASTVKLPQYKVLETQDSLLSPLYTEFFGFQAMLLEDQGTGKYVIAFRGTEGDEWTWNAVSDLASDFSMATGNVTEQMKLALHFVQKVLVTHGLSASDITFTGHSLGGSLAEIAGYTFGSDTYAYNPFGVKWSLFTSPATYNATLQTLGITSTQSTDNITNVVNMGGNFSDPITGVGSHLLNSYLGDIEYIKNSEGGNFAPHGMDELNESIAVYNNLLQLFRNEAYNSLTDKLDFIDPKTQQVESFLTSLGEIVSATPDSNHVTWSENISGTGITDLTLAALATTDSNGNITSLSPSDIKTLAESNIAYRYALVNLNPFAIVGASGLYTNFNQDGELDIYDPATGDGQLSDNYLTDRSAMLNQLIFKNINDGVSNSIIRYEDLMSGEVVVRPELNFVPQGKVVFGTDQGEILNGTNMPYVGDNFNDNLYGMGGIDTLNGYGGNDYLEGGEGNDILIGGADNDTLVGGKGNDTYRFALGDGNDTIHDSDGEGRIIITDASGNIIEVATGDFTRTTSGSNEWINSSGNITLTQGTSWVLTLSDGSTITIDSFEDGDLGINLVDNFTQTPEPTETTSDIFGDPQIHNATINPGGEADSWYVVKTYNQVYSEDANGNQVLEHYDVDYYLVDDNGNPTEDGGEEQDDVLHDTANNDHFMSGGGDDVIELDQGGDDIVETGSGKDLVNVNSDGNHVINMGADNDELYTLTANPGSLTVDGGSGRDYLGGGSGQDIIVGGEGADGLYGSGGDDRLYGDAEGETSDFIVQGAIEEGSGLQGEWIDAEDGNDQVFTGAGNDLIAGGDGDDLIVSGGGTDWIWGDMNTMGSYSDDNWRDWIVTETVTVEGNSTTYTYDLDNLYNESNLGAGDDVIYAGAGDDVAFGERGDDLIFLESGADKAWGGEGADIISGGEGNDILNGDNSVGTLSESLHGDDFLDGGDGNDVLYGMGGADILYGGTGDDQLQGGGGNDTLYGEADNDLLFGQQGDDTLSGGTGDDQLQGGDGEDHLSGDAGDDFLFGDADNDVLSGGSGGDELQGGDGNDILRGNADNDHLFGDAGGDLLDGGDGSDQLIGGEGDDTLYGGSENDLLIGDNGDGTGTGRDSLYGEDGDDQLQGGDGDDTLNGGTGNDQLQGGDGNDILIGGAGDDLLMPGNGNDMMDGGEGNDTYYFALGSGTKHLQDSGGYNHLIFQGGIGLNSIGLSLGSLMIGTGISGDELHLDGVDYDDLINTSPIDSVEFSDGTTMTLAEVVEAVGIDYTTTEDADMVTGTSARDNIDALAGDDVINSGAGNDIIDLGAGDDTADAGDGDDTISAGDGADIVVAGAGEDLLYGGNGNDSLSGGDGNDQLYGDLGDDSLSGGAGNDLLNGGVGGDAMAGGAGDDTYYVDSNTDSITEDLSSGDELVVSEIDYVLGDNLENLQLAEGSVAVNATGNDLDNNLQGNSLDNTLDGGEGADTLIGGAGNDQYLVDHVADAIIEEADGGSDVVTATVSYTLSANVETLILSGSAALDGTGNSQVNQIFGNEQNNTLNGGAGDDELYGGSGNDRLIGGTGADTLVGSIGNDIYSVNNTSDVIIELADEGTDTVESSIDFTLTTELENLTLTGSESISGEGNDGANIIIGNAGQNTLRGQDGNDEIYGGGGADHLYGDSGVDTLYGGTGNDTYHIDTLEDTLVEFSGEGSDTVESSISYSLGENFENITLIGTGDLQAIGNADSNQLVGNTGNNILDGGLGDDWMAGGAGNDSYYTDSEADAINENVDSGVDTEIRSHETLYLLSDNVENLSLTGTVYRGNGNELDNLIQGNAADNNLWGREGNDTLYGNAGDDQLIGAEGVDELVGGIGDDLLSGGTGNDTLDGGAGADQLDGGAGTNLLRGGLGDDTYVYRSGGGVDTIDNSDGGTDWLIFTDDLTSDRLGYIRSDDDLIVRVDENAETQVVISNWFLGGDYQIDFIQPANASGISAWTINRMFEPANPEADGLVTPDSSTFDMLWYGTQTAEQLAGTDGADLIRTYEGDDSLFGLAGDDWLLGGSGADYLDGGEGDDVLYGGEGNDQLGGAAGNDTLIGGAGDDIYVYSEGSGADTINNSGGGVDWLIFADGVTSDRLMYVQDGDDLIIRVDGDETTQVTVTNWFAGSEYQIAYIQPDGEYGIPAAQIETLLLGGATDFDTVVEGTAAAEQLVGSAGKDQLNGYAGNDQLFGLAGDDELNGGDGADYLDGGTGDDVQLGGAGNDQLGGDAGNDTLVGGTGDDIYVYAPGSGADTIDISDGGTDWLIFTGDITSDRMIYVQSGDDLIVRIDDDAATQVTISNWFVGSEYQLAYVQPAGENAIAAATINALFATSGTEDEDAIPTESEFDNVTTGTEVAEQLVGTSGMDLLQGLAGDDQLFGLSGDDWLVAGDGADYLDGGSGDDVQLGEAGNDQLGGDAGNDILVGGVGDDIYVYRPGSGADFIDNSGGGTDWLIFTDDITAGRLSYHRFGDDLQVRVDGDETTMVTVKHWFDGDDYKLSYIQPSGGYGISAASIESMLSTTSDSGFDALLTGTDGADVLTGSTIADQLRGYDGDDQLSALAGNDELSGDDGNDTLYGGSGDDSYLFNLGDGSDIIFDESGNDSIVFGDEVNSAGFAFLKTGTTMQIGYGTDDQITMDSYSDSTTGNRIETVTLADGSYLTDADINQLIQEMSAYAVAEGVSLNSLADVRQNEELMTMVAESWQAA